jgi:hypothetical protein
VLLRPQDLYVEVAGDRFDVTAGFARIVWGRLDEFQPGDVVNPLDITRFFLEGRSEARLPVALIRGRVFLPAGATLEGVLVPAFRPGRFDQLDEPTSPFNLAANPSVCAAPGVCVPVTIERHEPATSWDSVQGGIRANATIGRVDLGVSGYSGLDPFGLFSAPASALAPPAGGLPASPPLPFVVRQEFPRFTMLAADFEMVRGEWGFRGELAAFIRDTFQVPDNLEIIRGESIEGGLGVERKAGEYRLSGNMLIARARAVPLVEDTDISLVAALDRRFRRETVTLRGFGIYNASDRSGFVRSITAVSLRDDVWLEGSFGWFVGDGDDAVGRFADRDFLYARLKVHF